MSKSKTVQLDEEIDSWREHGPYTFKAINNIVQKCAAVTYSIDDDLEDNAYKFKMPDFALLICPHLRLKGHELRNWQDGSGLWFYKGHNFHLLDQQQLEALSELGVRDPSSLQFLFEKLNQTNLRKMLELARDLAAEEQANAEKKKQARDKSPRRRKR